MGAHTYGPGEDEPRDGVGPVGDRVGDEAVRVAAGSGGDPEPTGHRGEDTPAADAPEERPAPSTGTPETADVRPRRPHAAHGEASVGKQLREGWKRVVNAVATAVIILSVVIAIFLALHIVFEVFDANKNNGIVEFINGWATSLAYGFKDLFVPKDPTIRVTVNYALAAVVYLVVGRLLAGIIRRLG